MKSIKNNEKFKTFLVLIFFISFIVGFILRENIAGGAESDFLKFTWPAIQGFKNNFFDTLINYGKYGEGSLPLFHILNAYLNPFSYDPYAFQISISFISLLNVIVFSKILSNKYEINNLDSLLYASIFLILPFFRSSAFWGLTENLGWLFLLLSIKYYLEFKNKFNTSKTKNIFLFCVFSSMALYTRPYLIFFPIFLVMKTFLDKDYSSLKYMILNYFILAMPGFLLLYLWGGEFKLGDGEVNLISDYHNPKFILKNLVIFSSIFLLYYLPFLISEIFEKIKIDKKKFLKSFSIILIVLLLLNYLNLFDYLFEEELGGGALLKLNFLLFGNTLYFFIFISAIGLYSIFKLLSISRNNLILFLSLLIFCFPKYILQEYFEPLIIILLFTLFDFKKNSTKFIKDNKNIYIFFTYYLIYFFSSYFYRYKIFPAIN